jgi:hypothetical protein
MQKPSWTGACKSCRLEDPIDGSLVAHLENDAVLAGSAGL